MVRPQNCIFLNCIVLTSCCDALSVFLAINKANTTSFQGTLRSLTIPFRFGLCGVSHGKLNTFEMYKRKL